MTRRKGDSEVVWVPVWGSVPVYVMPSDTMSRIPTNKQHVDWIAQDKVSVWRMPGKNGFFFVSKMAIDADGAYDAYHPQDIGIDWLKHAGYPKNPVGLVKNKQGKFCVQGPHDPKPGYFVSQTSLYDKNITNLCNPRRYANSHEIPYIVLPANQLMGAKLGDYAAVINMRGGTMKVAYAIFADVGPQGYIGEGSIALANRLGINPNPKTGGQPGDVLYIVFPNTGAGQGVIPTPEEINRNGKHLFDAWGGMEQVRALGYNPK